MINLNSFIRMNEKIWTISLQVSPLLNKILNVRLSQGSGGGSSICQIMLQDDI